MGHLVWQRGSRQLEVRRNQFPDSERSVDIDDLVFAVVSPVAERAQQSGQAEDVVAVEVRDEDLVDPSRLDPGA